MMPYRSKKSDIDPRLREFFSGTSSKTIPDISTCAYREGIGLISLFKGMHEIRVELIGKDALEQVLIDTWDCRNGEWSRTRALPIRHCEVGDILRALNHAGIQLADLGSASREERPKFPLLAGEATSDYGTIRVLVDEYNDRLEVKLSRSDLAGTGLRNGQWAKVRPEDLRCFGSLMIQAYDRLTTTVTEIEECASATEDGSDLPF